MKKIIFLQLITAGFLSVSFSTCKNKKSATATAVENSPAQQDGGITISTSPATNPSTGTPAKEETYRLVVVFYSIGEGIDYKVNDTFVKFLDSYPKKIHYEPIHWGREGEIDYCLKLSELSVSEQDEFVKKTKELLGKSSLVHVNENALCSHKR